MTNKTLSRDDIVNVNDIQIEELPVPEWGGVVYVKTLTAEERDILEGELLQFSPNGNVKNIRLEQLRSTVAFLGICDENGERIFTDKKDIDLLKKKSAAALDRIVARIQTMSAMSPADIEKLTSELKNAPPAASLTA